MGITSLATSYDYRLDSDGYKMPLNIKSGYIGSERDLITCYNLFFNFKLKKFNNEIDYKQAPGDYTIKITYHAFFSDHSIVDEEFIFTPDKYRIVKTDEGDFANLRIQPRNQKVQAFAFSINTNLVQNPDEGYIALSGVYGDIDTNTPIITPQKRRD